MKCLRCVCAIETPEGIWCLKFRTYPEDAEAEKCKEFLDRKCLNLMEDGAGDENESF